MHSNFNNVNIYSLLKSGIFHKTSWEPLNHFRYTLQNADASYWPHDHRHHPHDDLIENIEEIRHDLPSLAHFPYADSKCDEEPN